MLNAKGQAGTEYLGNLWSLSQYKIAHLFNIYKAKQQKTKLEKERVL
jgi:hypothetical protein